MRLLDRCPLSAGFPFKQAVDTMALSRKQGVEKCAIHYSPWNSCVGTGTVEYDKLCFDRFLHREREADHSDSTSTHDDGMHLSIYHHTAEHHHHGVYFLQFRRQASISLGRSSPHHHQLMNISASASASASSLESNLLPHTKHQHHSAS